jgi:hypothetical protein
MFCFMHDVVRGKNSGLVSCNTAYIISMIAKILLMVIAVFIILSFFLK